jgi:hypothetical protein
MIKIFKTKSHLIISLSLLALLITSVLLLLGQAHAEDVTPVTSGSSDIPTLNAPLGTITEQYPAFNWTKVFAASTYQYQVLLGTTVVIDKNVSYDVCDSETCTVNPTNKLAFGPYTWRVRAYVTGEWKPWSEYASFAVSGPPFKAGFNNSMSGWKQKSGALWKTSSTAIYTIGKADFWTSVYKPYKQYVDFDYSVRMKRIGGVYEETWYPAQYVAVRMGTSVNTANGAWYPGYIFGYRDDGYFSIWEYDRTGAVSAIQPWTASEAIVPYGWNVLRLVAYGNSYDFYINGTLVYSFTGSIRSKGFVGVEMYKRSGATFTKLKVDWARLSITDLAGSRVGETNPAVKSINDDLAGDPTGGQK